MKRRAGLCAGRGRHGGRPLLLGSVLQWVRLNCRGTSSVQCFGRADEPDGPAGPSGSAAVSSCRPWSEVYTSFVRSLSRRGFCWSNSNSCLGRSGSCRDEPATTRQSMSQPAIHYVGIDIAQLTLVISGALPSEVKNESTVLLTWLRRLRRSQPTAHLICEATGRHHRAL